jgi:hypothetical protein
VPAVVHDLRDGRVCVRGHEHQVQALLLRDAKRFAGGDDAKLITVIIDRAELAGADPLVDDGRVLVNSWFLLNANRAGDHPDPHLLDQQTY